MPLLTMRVRRSPEMRPRPRRRSGRLAGGPYVSVAHQRCGLGRQTPLAHFAVADQCPSLTRDAASAANLIALLLGSEARVSVAHQRCGLGRLLVRVSNRSLSPVS